MANKEKILLLAMISMMLPGAMPDAFADTASEPEAKPAKRAHAPKAKTSKTITIKENRTGTTK